MILSNILIIFGVIHSNIKSFLIVTLNFDNMKKVNISLELSEPLRKIVIQALEPELVETGLRTQSEVSTTEAGIILSINADDTSALRAAINSYLRWIHCIITTANTFNPKNV